MAMRKTRGLDEYELEALEKILDYVRNEKKDPEGEEGEDCHIYESAWMLTHFLKSEGKIEHSSFSDLCLLAKGYLLDLWSFVQEVWPFTLFTVLYCAGVGLFISEVIRISVKHYCAH